MPASMASARLEKLEAGQADMRTNQMNLIDLSTQRPPHPRAVAGWTVSCKTLLGIGMAHILPDGLDRHCSVAGSYGISYTDCHSISRKIFVDADRCF